MALKPAFAAQTCKDGDEQFYMGHQSCRQQGELFGKIESRHQRVQDPLGCCRVSCSTWTQLAVPCPGAEHHSHGSSIPQPRASPRGRVSAARAPAQCRSGGMLLLLTLHRVPRTRLQLGLTGELNIILLFKGKASVLWVQRVSPSPNNKPAAAPECMEVQAGGRHLPGLCNQPRREG